MFFLEFRSLGPPSLRGDPFHGFAAPGLDFLRCRKSRVTLAGFAGWSHPWGAPPGGFFSDPSFSLRLRFAVGFASSPVELLFAGLRASLLS
jgi:hypothetical protein